ncbi:MAG: ParB/RepB/Spo0J family partition protein [Oscillospiraceae bacterium]|nr:ParB/RepB/Spo0J family partition protein [Oscillospiraceae bacterium]
MAKPKTMMETGRVVHLPVQSIRPNPTQPRKVFDQNGLQELAASIVQYGILQPLTVRRKDGGYELVAGERRLRAARLAGLTEVPCIVMALDEEQSGMLALVENLQRRDLDFIEEAEGLARLMRLYGLSQEQAAMRVGKSQSAVANKLRLLRHSSRVLDELREHHLSERHARALLKLPTEQERLDALAVIVEKEMNVAKTEQYIDRLLEKKEHTSRGLKGFVLRDVRVFLNTVNHNLDIIRSAGIDADCGQEETEDEIVLTIRIPKKAG